MASEVIGGQAVIEGVMMMNGSRQAIAVRDPKGKIVVKKNRVRMPKSRIAKLPGVRGVVNLFFMMIIGLKALNYSADVSLGEEEESFSSFQVGLLMMFSILFALALFKFLPLLITKYFVSKISFLSVNNFIPNILDGVLKIGIFIFYIWLITFSGETRRVFEYHGAEHKVIRCKEAGQALTVNNVRGFSCFHPRCGTAFVFGVFMISIFVFSLIPFNSTTLWENFALRLMLLPVVMGISYEALRLSGKNEGSVFFRGITAPGLWMQRLTTREPTDKQLEVSIAALKGALEK